MGNLSCGGSKQQESDFDIYMKNYFPVKGKQSDYEYRQNFDEKDSELMSQKVMVFEDETSKRVEKQENLAKQKEKNRVVEYLILLSSEVTNNIGAASTSLCGRPPVHEQYSLDQASQNETIKVQSEQMVVSVQDLGPGLPKPISRYSGSPGNSSTLNTRKKGSVLPKIQPKSRL
eukprot:403346141